MIEILPTNTCPPDFPELIRRSDAFAQFAPHIHLDLDDARFAPALSWPYGPGQWEELEAMLVRHEKLPHADTAPYEVHLMVEEPLRIGSYMARMGARRIIGHVETFVDTHAVEVAFSAWKAGGAQEVGLAVLLDTPLEKLEPHIASCDMVLLMSIATLGKQGAPFDEHVYERIEHLHAAHPDLVIGVDGGVSGDNIEKLVRAGARRFGVGSAITRTPDPKQAYTQLLTAGNAAV